MIKTGNLRKQLLIDALEGRANVYRLIGEYDEAIQDYQKAIFWCKKGTKPDSLLIANLIIHLADIFREGKNDYDKSAMLIKKLFNRMSKKNKNALYPLGLNILGIILTHRGRYKQALEYHKKALSINKKLKDKTETGKTYLVIGDIYYYTGDFTNALKYYKKSATILKTTGNKTNLDIAYNNIGSIYYDQGKSFMALKYYKRSLNISEKIESKLDIGVTCGNIGTVYHSIGNLDIALKYYEKSINILKQIDYKIGITTGYNNLGAAYYDKGRFHTALRYYRKSLSTFQEIGYYLGIGLVYLKMGQAYTGLRNFSRADKYLKLAEKIFMGNPNKKILSKIYIGFSELYYGKKDYEGAFKHANKALSLTRETKIIEQKISALRLMGKAIKCLTHNTGHTMQDKAIPSTKKAISYLEESIALARRYNMKLELAKSLYELGKVYLPSRETENAKGETEKKALRYLKEAAEIFKKAGAELWLKKVKNLIA